MKGENFSLYKNIKSLCKEIYNSIKYNDSHKLNNCSNSFRDINIALNDKITSQSGGYNQNIENLKQSIMNKIHIINNLKGGEISQKTLDLKQDIINKIKSLEIKDMKESFKTIEKTLTQVLIFIETYKTLQGELRDKQGIIDAKFNPDSKDVSEALRALMNGINPTELSKLQDQLEVFTKNIKTIVNDNSPSGPEDLEKAVKDSCKTYLPNTTLSINPLQNELSAYLPPSQTPVQNISITQGNTGQGSEVRVAVPGPGSEA
jgi:phage host-nuclease inhibitor protein Gam